MKLFQHLDDWPENLENRFKKPVTCHSRNWASYSHKTKIHENLLLVQNHICPYCEIELKRENGHVGFHIEHIAPKSKFPYLTFDYINLMLSCFTRKDELKKNDMDTSSLSCGHFKDDNFCVNLFIKPTDVNCETYFLYDLDGCILPSPGLCRDDTAKAKYTIRRLNLNCTRLTRERRDLIEQIFKGLNKTGYEGDGVRNFCNLELSIKDGKSKAFITTRQQYLQDFL